jgi:hypothetical protein
VVSVAIQCSPYLRSDIFAHRPPPCKGRDSQSDGQIKFDWKIKFSVGAIVGMRRRTVNVEIVRHGAKLSARKKLFPHHKFILFSLLNSDVTVALHSV